MISIPKNQKLIELGFGIETDDELLLAPFELKYIIEKGYLGKENENLIENVDDKLYLVFKDLRERGYILRTSEDSDLLRVYRKGYRRGEDRTLHVLRVLNAEIIEIKNLGEDSTYSGKMRKDLVYAYVNKENKIFYISISRKVFP